MNSSNDWKCHVHLVGSVPLQTAEEVFLVVAETVGARICRIPDGETGDRADWILHQRFVFDRHPAFERYEIPPDPRAPERKRFRYRLRAGQALPAAETLGPLGYAEAARASYDVFSRLKALRTIDSAARFQVTFPSPYDVIGFLVDHTIARDVLPAYRACLATELTRIADIIPHSELAVQWDIAHEFEYLASNAPVFLPSDRDEIIAELVRLGEIVPPAVELGYHCCYGDFNHRHFIEPTDVGDMVDVIYGVSAAIGRTVEFVHMPVPRDRSDDAYFAPFAGMRLRPETELFLGLVHNTDGLEGTLRRMKTARRFVPRFGVATECGLGRRPPETIPGLLRVHARAAAAMDGA